MFIRHYLQKIKNRIIKLLGGYTPLTYKAVYQLYTEYRRECMEYRMLVGTLAQAEQYIERLNYIESSNE